MSYESWHENHSLKHKKLMQKLSHLSKDEIIDYFDFENMKLKEPDFCPLYKDDKKCHEIDNLNCYLCACPNFRVGKSKSFCSINSKYGGSIEVKDYTHQDCSNCFVPHKKKYVEQNFNKNWLKVFSKTFT